MRYEPHYHLLGLQLTIDRMTAGSQEKKKQLSANKAKTNMSPACQHYVDFGTQGGPSVLLSTTHPMCIMSPILLPASASPQSHILGALALACTICQPA